jgi:serine O-acetyltransferase
MDISQTWSSLRQLAHIQRAQSVLLHRFYDQNILQQETLACSISFLLADKLQGAILSADKLQDLFRSLLENEPDILRSISEDLQAFVQRDSACQDLCHAYCFYKGFHALCAYRMMHSLWKQGRILLALQLQQRCSTVLDVDIHPAARLGSGIMFDHATGIVIGETAVVGNRVSIMQGVTLGGTGKEKGDRHPKINDEVLISVGATVLGNIIIGKGAQIVAGSVALKTVPAHTTAAGVPAQVIGKTASAHPALEMNHKIQ